MALTARKWLVTAFALHFFFYAAGLPLLLLGGLFYLKSTASQRHKEKAIHCLSYPKGQEANLGIQWVKEHEFRYQGKMCDVEKKSEQNGKVTLAYHVDDDESLLLSFLASMLDHGYGSAKKAKDGSGKDFKGILLVNGGTRPLNPVFNFKFGTHFFPLMEGVGRLLEIPPRRQFLIS